jgi:signal transduction histidine kinase
MYNTQLMNQFGTLFAIYFVYGLAFFSMGLVLMLEAGRTSPAAPQNRLLKPLGIFGMLHGLHEWMEIFIFQAEKLEGALPAQIFWAHTILLGLSFVALWVYAIEAFRYTQAKFSALTYFGAVTLPLFALLVLADVYSAFILGRINLLEMTGGLVRYLLAVPGAALATLGLHSASLKARVDQRPPLDRYLNWVAIGFALYSVTQIFVSRMDTILAGAINADAFLAVTGIPIQAVRTVVALVITINLFKAAQFLEEERQKQLNAAQQARLEALEQQEILRRDLLRHTVRAQEEERARIARELHDEMAQILTAFSLDLGTLQNNLPPDPTTAPLLQRLHDLARQMSQGMYRMVRDLRPAHLDDLGLIPALQYLIQQDFKGRGLNVTLEISGTPQRVDPLIETILFRVAQEALTNVQRYAQTSEAQLSLDYEADRVRLRIADQGRGFDPDGKFVPPHGWGLAGMKERAESVGGTLLVVSHPNQGALIEISVPLASAPGD